MRPLCKEGKGSGRRTAALLLVLLLLPVQAAAERPFGTGERLDFDVYYGPLKAGSATMEVGPVSTLRGREVLRLTSTARSGRVISAFFPVRDRVHSYLDVEALRPLRFEKHLREGRYECDRVVDFYHGEGVALSGDRTIEITERTMDALSALYWVRTEPLPPGRTLWVASTSSREPYDLRVDVTHRETLRTPAGEFDCVVVEPHLARDGGIFDHKGRMWIWLTDDALHLPVQMVTEVAIGSIRAVLVDHVLGAVASGEVHE